MKHEKCRILDFNTPAGPLMVVVCTCARMFDAARFDAHIKQVAA